MKKLLLMFLYISFSVSIFSMENDKLSTIEEGVDDPLEGEIDPFTESMLIDNNEIEMTPALLECKPYLDGFGLPSRLPAYKRHKLITDSDGSGDDFEGPIEFSEASKCNDFSVFPTKGLVMMNVDVRSPIDHGNNLEEDILRKVLEDSLRDFQQEVASQNDEKSTKEKGKEKCNAPTEYRPSYATADDGDIEEHMLRQAREASLKDLRRKLVPGESEFPHTHERLCAPDSALTISSLSPFGSFQAHNSSISHAAYSHGGAGDSDYSYFDRYLADTPSLPSRLVLPKINKLKELVELEKRELSKELFTEFQQFFIQCHALALGGITEEVDLPSEIKVQFKKLHSKVERTLQSTQRGSFIKQPEALKQKSSMPEPRHLRLALARSYQLYCGESRYDSSQK